MFYRRITNGLKVAGKVTILGLAANLLLPYNKQTHYSNCLAQLEEDDKPKWPFDTKGLPYRFTPGIPVTPQTPPLYLIGVGTITEPGYLYQTITKAKIAIGCSNYTIDRAREWYYHKTTNTENKLAEYLLKRQNTITPYYIANPLKVAAIIYIVDSNGMKATELMGHLKGALKDISGDVYDTFKENFMDTLGDRKLKKGDEIALYWFDNGDLMFAKNNDIRAIIHVPELNQPLLEAFIRKGKTFTPELAECIEEHIPFIQPM